MPRIQALSSKEKLDILVAGWHARDAIDNHVGKDALPYASSFIGTGCSSCNNFVTLILRGMDPATAALARCDDMINWSLRVQDALAILRIEESK